jgi:hypothetical protein
MSSYVKPQVLVFQEFRIVPTEITEPLRAHIAGPHAVLHRYRVNDEKNEARLGVYNRLEDTCYSWPGREPGSNVDFDYTKLYIDDAMLLYYEHNIGSPVEHNVTAVAGKTNWINSNVLSFKTNGGYPRSNVFLDRDVQLGDVVYLRTVVDAEDSCVEHELETYVTGFASEAVDSVIEPAFADDNNQDSTSANVAITTVHGDELDNCVTVAVAMDSDYDGLASGDITEEYLVEVVKSSTTGCNAARLRVTSASGRDNVVEMTPADFGSSSAIGTRGLKVVFSNTSNPSCTAIAGSNSIAATSFVVGQKWRVVVSQSYEAVTAETVALDNDNLDETGNILGEYAGLKNDTYIVECTKGGEWANRPEITVRTVKGLDFSGPTEVTATNFNVSIAIGSSGVRIRFLNSEGIAGLRKGDKWYVPVTATAAGPVRRLILRDDLPSVMLTATELDLKLFIKDNIQVSQNRIGFAPQVNYTVEETQICVKEGVIAYHPEWTSAGAEQPLEVRAGTLYVEYREWLSELADQVNAINNTGDLDNIKGQLDPDNPLKWGVYKALANSNGTAVKYTAVAEPDLYDTDGKKTGVNLDSWAEVLERLKGRDDFYNLVPLTFNRQVQNLWAAQTVSESNEFANDWKAAVVSLQSRPTVMVVGEGAPIGGVSGNVIADPVLAVLEDDPNATNTQYTRLRIPSGAGYFITNNVRPGDVVRYLFSVDGFGEEQYQEFVVDEVVSETTLRLYSGGDAPVTVPQRVEIYHNNNRNEVADDVAEQAGGFGSRRVVAVWPDQVGEGGTMQPGYYLAAALAGLASGVVPQQGLTNVEVAGFDDYTRSYKYFNETQLNRMAEAGVWIVTEDRDGTPHTRHAVTTDNLDLNRREEMIRRNVDSMSYLFLRRLRPYIGRTNATPAMITLLRNQLTVVINSLKTNGATDEIGSQLIDGAIRILRIHPLLKDRIEVVLDLTVPAPLNNIELHLVV